MSLVYDCLKLHKWSWTIGPILLRRIFWFFLLLCFLLESWSRYLHCISFVMHTCCDIELVLECLLQLAVKSFSCILSGACMSCCLCMTSVFRIVLHLLQAVQIYLYEGCSLEEWKDHFHGKHGRITLCYRNIYLLNKFPENGLDL